MDVVEKGQDELEIYKRGSEGQGGEEDMGSEGTTARHEILVKVEKEVEAMFEDEDIF